MAVISTKDDYSTKKDEFSPKNEFSMHVLQNGLIVPKFVQQEELNKLKDLELYSDDVWVVTYPKCGTTWAQQIVRLIRSKGKPDGVNMDFAVPWLEAAAEPHIKKAKFTVNDLQRPRAFKSHFPCHLLPCGTPDTTPCKYIYVARNPKDVAVSLYFHTKIRYFPGIAWDSFWKKYVGADLEFGNYFDHLESWLPHKDDENVLFLKYEDMKKDLKQAVTDIASFIGANNLSSEVIGKIADLTSFDKMKKDNTANYSWSEMQQKENVPSFMRKGVVGDWKNYLTEEQSAEIDAMCAERLEGTGLEFEFE